MFPYFQKSFAEVVAPALLLGPQRPLRRAKGKAGSGPSGRKERLQLRLPACYCGRPQAQARPWAHRAMGEVNFGSSHFSCLVRIWVSASASVTVSLLVASGQSQA